MVSLFQLYALQASSLLQQSFQRGLSRLFSANSGNGFGKKNIADMPSNTILSIPSFEELQKSSMNTKLNFLQNNVYRDGKKKIFDDTIKFPASFPLKVMGENTEGFITGMR